MTRFSDVAPLNQPEHRLGILAVLPEDAVVAIARVAARDQDMEWLEPMVRGGLLDPDDFRRETGKAAVSSAVAWAKRAEAFTGFLQNIAFDNIQHDALLGALDKPMPVLVHHAREDTQSLFGYAIGRIVPVFKQIEASHPDWAPSSPHAVDIGRMVDKGMATLVCGAIAMDLPNAVHAIVREFPSTASLEFPLSNFGTHFERPSASSVGSSQPAKGRINAVGLAVRLSRTECLDHLIESDPNALQTLGTRSLGTGEGRLSISNMPEFVTPHCTPAMWGKVTERVYDQTNLWNKPVEPGQDEPIRIQEVLESHPPVSLLRGPFAKPMAPYIAAMNAVGVYDFNPEHMLSEAVAAGQPLLVERMVEKVSDWALVEQLFRPPNSPISRAASNANQESDPERRAKHEAAVMAFLRGSLAHGQKAGFLHSPENDWPHDSESSMEPFYSVAKAGFNDVVVLYLDQGFDLRQKCPPDEDSSNPYTVMEQLARDLPDATAVVRSYLARSKAFNLLDEMDENKTADSKP